MFVKSNNKSKKDSTSFLTKIKNASPYLKVSMGTIVIALFISIVIGSSLGAGIFGTILFGVFITVWLNISLGYRFD